MKLCRVAFVLVLAISFPVLPSMAWDALEEPVEPVCEVEETVERAVVESAEVDLGFEPERVPVSGLCIEPSPCTTSAECGYTIEGYPGVCVPNLGYPEVPSDKVCICP